MTGRTDLEVIAVPTADEAEGWAVVEPDVAADPDGAYAVRTRVATAEADRVQALDVLASAFPPAPPAPVLDPTDTQRPLMKGSGPCASLAVSRDLLGAGGRRGELPEDLGGRLETDALPQVNKAKQPVHLTKPYW